MRIKALLCCLCCWYAVQASVPVKWKVEYLVGTLMQGSRIDPLIDKPVMGAEVAAEFMLTLRMPWAISYNGASVGVAATYLNLGNNAKLGNAVALYPYLNVPLVNTRHFILSLKPGVGISFVNKRYANTSENGALGISNPDNPQQIANSAFGSVLNAYFAGMLSMEFPISQGVSIAASGGWNHISNGSFIQPNGGVNMFNVQVGVKYFPQHASYQSPDVEVADVKCRWSFDVIASGGCRQLYYRDNRFFPVASLQVGVFYRCANIFRIGLGGDVFYDGVYASVNSSSDPSKNISSYKFTYLTDDRWQNHLRAGVSLQPEFVIGKLTAGFHFGVYMYDPIKNLEPYAVAQSTPQSKGIFYKYNINKEDGWFYTRASLKYEVTPHLLLAIGLKTHLHRAEFIEWGVGYRF